MTDGKEHENPKLYALLEEYRALTEESREYARLQNWITLLLPLLFSSVLMMIMLDGRGLAALLVFPWASAMLVIAWSQLYGRRLAIISYISDRMEPPLSLFACTYRKIWLASERNRSTPFRPGQRISLPALALSVQWFFIGLDILNLLLLIAVLVFSPTARQTPAALLFIGFFSSLLLLCLKYWLLFLYPWEQYLTGRASSVPTVIKEANCEVYPLFRHAVEQSEELSIPPAFQSFAYANLLYEQLLLVEQGTLEIRDGTATPQQRLDHRSQFVKICTTGDIVRIPAGFTYIIVNPSPGQEALIRHRRLLTQEPFIR